MRLQHAGEGKAGQLCAKIDPRPYQVIVDQVELDESTIQQRQAELHAAQVNLDYTDIVSPVDGTVVARNITLGQTVAMAELRPISAPDGAQRPADDVGGAASPPSDASPRGR